ncbi:MAG: hypothetical protein ABS948_00905 [Solibacillus sp.]
MTSVTNALSHDATVLAFVHLIPRARLQLFLLLPYGAAKERIFHACCSRRKLCSATLGAAVSCTRPFRSNQQRIRQGFAF